MRFMCINYIILIHHLLPLPTIHIPQLNIDQLMNCNSGSNGNTGSSSDNVLSGGGGGGAVIAPGVSTVVENSQQVQLVQPPVSLPTALAGFTPQQLTLMQQMMALQQVGMLPQMMGLLGMPSPLTVAAGVSGGGVVLGNGDNTNSNSSNNNNNVGEGEDGGTVTAATKLEQ